MTDIRLVKTWKLWGMNDTGRGSMTLWIRQPISSIFEHKEPHDDMEPRLTVRTTDGQEVTCDDTPENRKALGMVEAGSPPSILLRPDVPDDPYHVNLEKTFEAIKKAKDEAGR